MDLRALQEWLRRPECRLLKKVVRHRLAHLQAMAGGEALKTISEDRDREISQFATEAAQLENLLAKLLEFENPNVLLGTYTLVAPDF